MLKELNAANIPVHGVFGNNDGDQYLLTRMSILDLENIYLHGMIGEVDADGFSIQFTHDQRVAEGLAASAGNNLVCFGHTHEYSQKNVNGTVLLNPGEIMGKDGSPGFCMVDSKTSEVLRVNLKE
jgi:putative phosphoesterase